MPAADFWRFIPSPRDDGSPKANHQISPGITHSPSRLSLSDLRRNVRASIGLCMYWPAHPAASPLSAGCSSEQRFAYGFLRIPPHGGHPCRSANTSPCRVCRGLTPPSECALPGAPKNKKASLDRQSRLTAEISSLRSVSDPPAGPRVSGDCARELPLPIHPTVCFEVGRFALTQSSRPTLTQRCSRKWMSGHAAYALVLSEDRGQFATPNLYPSGEHLPPSRRESPFPVDFYLSWMSPLKLCNQNLLQ